MTIEEVKIMANRLRVYDQLDWELAGEGALAHQQTVKPTKDTIRFATVANNILRAGLNVCDDIYTVDPYSLTRGLKNDKRKFLCINLH